MIEENAGIEGLAKGMGIKKEVLSQRVVSFFKEFGGMPVENCPFSDQADGNRTIWNLWLQHVIDEKGVKDVCTSGD